MGQLHYNSRRYSYITTNQIRYYTIALVAFDTLQIHTFTIPGIATDRVYVHFTFMSNLHPNPFYEAASSLRPLLAF